MIYTCSALTLKHNSCPRGPNWLERNGLPAELPVSMGAIVRTLGVYDALFSHCEVFPECELESRKVLSDMMLHITGLACRFLLLTEGAHCAEKLAQANRLINQRAAGKQNTNGMRKQLLAIQSIKYGEDLPQLKHWYMVYQQMLAPHPDYMAVMQGARCLVDGAEAAGCKDEIYAELRRVYLYYLAENDGPPLTKEEVETLGNAYRDNKERTTTTVDSRKVRFRSAGTDDDAGIHIRAGEPKL